MIRYGSVCSGIEAATVAWHPLGWTPAFFSEIEAAPRAVLSHHFPDVPLHGDFTTIKGGDYGAIDLLVGGTPCQSFSVAGLRGGLDDVRGNLALEFLRLADRKRPRWLVWENVPGVLSSGEGRDFGSILGGPVVAALTADGVGTCGADASDISPTLRAGGHSGSHANAGVMPAVALMENQRAEIRLSSATDALATGGGKPGQGYAATFNGSAVRRLTPRECERLQGFPDDFTLVPYRKGMMADGPRYKMLGNSMAVPVVRWIGMRIAVVESLSAERLAA